MGYGSVHFAAFALCIVWAIYFVLAKYLMVSGISVTAVSLILRIIVVGILIIPCLKIPAHRRNFQKKHWKYLITVSAMFTCFTYLSLWAYQLYDQGVANSAVLWRTDIVFSIIMGRILLGERVKTSQYFALAGMIAGVLLITKTSLSGYQFQWVGDLCIILAAFMLTTNAFIIRMRLSEVNDTMLAAMNNATSGLMLAGIYVVLSFSQDVFGADVAVFAQKPELLAVCLLSGLFSATIFLLYYYCLRRLPVWELRAYMLFIPFFAAPIVWFVPFLDDEMTSGQIVGMFFIVIFGLLLMFLCRPRGSPARI